MVLFLLLLMLKYFFALVAKCLHYILYFLQFYMKFSLSVSMEITSCTLPSNYTVAHQLKTIDLEYPNLLQAQKLDLNLKKILVSSIFL